MKTTPTKTGRRYNMEKKAKDISTLNEKELAYVEESKSEQLTDEENEIIREYFANGFKKGAAYGAVRKYKTKNSRNTQATKFFQRKKIRKEVEMIQDLILGSRMEMINKLAHDLTSNIFEREVVGDYTYKDRQRDMELLIKITGIDKAPKFKDDITPLARVEDIVINITGGDNEEKIILFNDDDDE